MSASCSRQSRNSVPERWQQEDVATKKVAPPQPWERQGTGRLQYSPGQVNWRGQEQVVLLPPEPRGCCYGCPKGRLFLLRKSGGGVVMVAEGPRTAPHDVPGCLTREPRATAVYHKGAKTQEASAEQSVAELITRVWLRCGGGHAPCAASRSKARDHTPRRVRVQRTDLQSTELMAAATPPPPDHRSSCREGAADFRSGRRMRRLFGSRTTRRPARRAWRCLLPGCALN